MRSIGAAIACAALVLFATAQSPRPSFEAASIKTNESSSPLVRLSTPTGRLSGVNVTLRMLIRNAYLLQDFRMSGGPAWIDTDRFDVEATAGASVGFDQVRAMERTLLEDRFHLKTHTETRELPIYVLSVARRDGKLGDQIKASGTECLPMKPPAGAPPPPPPPPGSTPTGAPQCPSMLAPGNVSGRKITIARLATTLSLFVNREIIDKTNLAGEFDLDLRWLPDQLPFVAPGTPAPPVDTTAAPLFTAIQEQLGLKLESSRGPVEVLVIETAEKPTED
ncbi:MAG TPA: TIGR03435 family protein [Vicinamibacterales bacterium]|nr:TIGR03435 family protein [Vicinamibacterales bacterium]